MSASQRWSNWSGSLRFTPGVIAKPESEQQVTELIRNAVAENRQVRVVGAGHSSTPLVFTRDVLLSLEHFKGVENVSVSNKTAIVKAGMTVKEAGSDLYRYGLAMHNTGDVDVQTLAGAIGTGTHGTGKKLANLSSMLIGARMITGTGDIIEVDSQTDPEVMKALRIAMGTCGIFLQMKLQLEALYKLNRQEWCVPVDKCLENIDSLMENRNFDFYWYPRSDMAKIRIMNREEDPMPKIDYGTLAMEETGYSHEILPRSRELKFDEMEYALPLENAVSCFEQVRELVKKSFRKDVAWRVLFRTIKSDDAYLSPMYKRESVTISLHQNIGVPFWPYFKAIEPIFLKHGGRPHWAKKHTLQAEQLRGMYTEWETFHEFREKLDPQRLLLSPYMDKLLFP